jgi:hypothetical protein
VFECGIELLCLFINLVSVVTPDLNFTQSVQVPCHLHVLILAAKAQLTLRNRHASHDGRCDLLRFLPAEAMGTSGVVTLAVVEGWLLSAIVLPTTRCVQSLKKGTVKV